MPWGVTASRSLLARAVQQQGDTSRAEALYEELLTDFREHGGDAYVSAHSLNHLGSLAQARGDDERALPFFAEALVRFNDLGDLGSVAWCLEGVAAVGSRDHPEQAARLFAAADALRTAIDVPLPPAERAEYDHAVGRVRAALGESAFNAAWLAGAVLPRDAALTEASNLAASQRPIEASVEYSLTNGYARASAK